ncbi:hypothetical protein [Robertkochia aurantiaca]|uniref:hypothetical protein n=1 Tax=Robertkochia aurantiaca TaxID=2873700 RepID=UPI001CCFF3B5|nr:hypothetical protein [Robertkochia sp. 3YJGBD-33]
MEENYLDDLKTIRQLMNRSSRFLSLSGISGVAAGIVGIAAAWFFEQYFLTTENWLVYQAVSINAEQRLLLVVTALAALFTAIGLVLFFTWKETKKNGEKVWDLQSKRLLINLGIPLVSGGIFCLMVLDKGYIGWLPALTLIFYGCALVNGSKYTVDEIRTLGLIEILTGLLAFYFISFSVYLWGIGFGLMHLIYGIIIYKKRRS